MNQTPFHYAVLYNSKEIVELLISTGADIKSIDTIYQNLEILLFIKRIENK